MGMTRVQKAQASKRKRRAAKQGTPKAMREAARGMGRARKAMAS